MSTALYAPGALIHHPQAVFNPRLAGWWSISADPWRFPEAIPDPLRRPEPAASGRRWWVTTPTLQFWHQLTETNFTTGYTIHEAWLSPGRQVLRPWARRINDAWEAAHARGDVLLAEHIKMMYRGANGLFNHEHNRIYRPDWHYTTIGQAVATLLRKAWRHGWEMQQWPRGLATDALIYPPGVTVHQAAVCTYARCPVLHIDNDSQALGTFKIKETTRA